GVLRYGTNPITAVVDRSIAGKKVRDVLAFQSDVPIVASVKEAFDLGADAMLLGCAYVGGQLPAHWRADIFEALELRLDVINGLHDFLQEDPEFVSAARKTGTKLTDLRMPPPGSPVAAALARDLDAFSVLTVGSDCSVGKMTASLELWKEASRRGIKSKFLATGQTGIAIAGAGVPVDRVIGDFMAGAIERMLLENAAGQEMLFVEGQGSLVHPGYSGVTLSLLHGCAPASMILCHKAGHTQIGEGGSPIPPIPTLISIYETMASFIRPAKVAGLALNTRTLPEREAREEVQALADLTGLPCTDPVRFGAGNLVDALVEAKSKTRSKSTTVL
ncbi:MAG: DUF1611 domain-containing protein, partial [Cyanobacteria bacterium]|nr:DUF1611 domain-containing protein [Cyanobacteriota bacterium]